MSEVLTDFIKNAGLSTLAHFLVTTISIFIGIALFFFARMRKQMSWFLAVGILPALSGILTMYFKNKYSGVGMFAPPGREAIAAAHREAWIDLSMGISAATVILVLRNWRQRINARKNR